MKLIKGIFAGLAVAAVLAFAAAPAGALEFVQPGGPWSTGTDSTQDIAAGDLNGDGRDDVVTADYDPDGLSVFLAGPDGSLASPVRYATTGVPYGIALGDLNNDGDLDLIASGNSRINVRLGNGDGTFGTETSTANPGYDGIFVETGQFNGGANLDVIIGDYTSGNVGLFLGNGAGSLVPNGSVAAATSPVEATVGDFNEDGTDDFATANYNTFFAGAITVVLVDSNGQFTPGSGSPLGGDYQPRGITSGDYNDDGNLDLAVVNSPNQALSVKLGNGLGAFSDAPSLPGIPSRWGESIASADFDDDGFEDFGVGWSTSISGEVDDSTGVWLGAATGAMTEDAGSPWANSSPTYPWFMTTGDFNGDGRPDMANADLSGGVSVFLNEGPPSLTAMPTNQDFGEVEVGDASPAQTFTIGNTSSAMTIAISAISITGSDAGQFSVTGTTCSAPHNVAPGETCQVAVEFEPTSIGAKSASLALTNNGTINPLVVPLSGTGAPNPGVAIAPASIDYGTRFVNDGPSATQDFTVSSTGTTPVTVTGLGTSGDAADFMVDSSDCAAAVLPPEDTCVIEVAFDPASAGSKSMTVSVSSDASNMPATATATGHGQQVVRYSLAPVSRDFGTRLTDAGFGEPATFTLTNEGGSENSVAGVTLSGSGSESWRIAQDGCTGVAMAPEMTCNIQVEFGPTTAGEKTSTLGVSIEGSDPVSAQLTGSGQDPVPPPDPCEPVAIKKVAYFTPNVRKRSNIPGVRARITTAGPADVRISSKVIYHLQGKQGQINFKQRQFRVATDSLNYKVAIPKKLRKKLRPKRQVRFVITYASKSTDPECTKFGEKKTRNLTTRIVWVIPNG